MSKRRQPGGIWTAQCTDCALLYTCQVIAMPTFPSACTSCGWTAQVGWAWVTLSFSRCLSGWAPAWPDCKMLGGRGTWPWRTRVDHAGNIRILDHSTQSNIGNDSIQWEGVAKLCHARQNKQNMASRRKIKVKNTDSRFPAEQNLGAHTIKELNSGTHYKKLNCGEYHRKNCGAYYQKTVARIIKNLWRILSTINGQQAPRALFCHAPVPLLLTCILQIYALT